MSSPRRNATSPSRVATLASCGTVEACSGSSTPIPYRICHLSVDVSLDFPTERGRGRRRARRESRHRPRHAMRPPRAKRGIFTQRLRSSVLRGSAKLEPLYVPFSIPKPYEGTLSRPADTTQNRTFLISGVLPKLQWLECGDHSVDHTPYPLTAQMKRRRCADGCRTASTH